MLAPQVASKHITSAPHLSAVGQRLGRLQQPRHAVPLGPQHAQLGQGGEAAQRLAGELGRGGEVLDGHVWQASAGGSTQGTGA